jgi:5-methylcytosine-specific restriction endonuclease McrBC GTP-binding regulatory subunit McrB
VRPDWRDSTSLLGYFNPLTGQYQWTDFLTFILRAAESYKAGDGLAWFVILDEMNLAHVEYYFADLLSVIESGRGKNGFSKEPLRTSYPESGEEDDVPPREIFLPPSLYIIGTVNMDETTHAFSPKVLDRAFTIELTEVDFEHYLPATVGAGSAIDDAQKQAMLAAFTRDGRFAQIDKREVAEAVTAHPEIRDRLQSLNVLLQRNRFHFGYRIFDEIAQYIHNNDINGMMPFEEAFDQAVFMKVLPKFTGSRSRLRTPLLSLLAWSIDSHAVWPHGMADRFELHLKGVDTSLVDDTKSAPFSSVAERALQMLETLETDGFVSFG